MALRLFRRPVVNDDEATHAAAVSHRASSELLAARHHLLLAPRWELVPIKSIDQAIAELPAGAPISVTCSPVKGIEHTLDLASRLLAEGHDAVPHFAARMVEGPEQARRLAVWCRDHAIHEVFIIAGDAPEPHGVYNEAVPFIRDFLDADPCISIVGVPGYPDGHASIETPLLRNALIEKQRLIADAGLVGAISTQMCFDSTLILSWLQSIRDDGITLPVRLGIPGAVERAKLVSMGTRLGIGESLRYLRKNAAVISKLVGPGGYDPLELLDEIAPSAEALGISGLHVFTFNAIEATIDWWHRACIDSAPMPPPDLLPH